MMLLLRKVLVRVVLGCIAFCQACSEGGAPRERGDSAISAADDAGGPAFFPEAGPDCQLRVADPLIEHACFHARFGPYHARSVEGDDDVSRAHTAFEIALAQRDEGYGGRVRYMARAAGAYALFTRGVEQLSVRPLEGGSSLPPFLEHDTEICAELPWSRAYALEARDYIIELTSPEPSVVLVIESMEEGAREDNFTERCESLWMDGGAMDAAALPQRDAGALDAQTPTEAGFPPSDGGTAVEDAGREDAGAVCLVDPVLEHACLHVEHGPFAQVNASAGGAAPNVNAPHTYFTVTMPGEGQKGQVTYRPAQHATYVLYLGGARVIVRDPSQEPVSTAYEEAVVGCAGLERAQVYTLEQAAKYTLELHPDPGIGTATLLIENVDSFTDKPWPERFEVCP